MKDKHWKIYELKIKERVDNLLKNKFYFESIFLFSNILEVEIKDLIHEHQRACKHILNEEKIKFYPKILLNIEDNNITLGKLRKHLASFIKDKKILERIDKFNKLRIDVIHKLFDKNLEQLENRIKNFVPDFYRLMEELVDKKISIMQNLNKYKEKSLVLKYKLKKLTKVENLIEKKK